MKMTKNFTLIFQIAATFAQFVIIPMPVLPEEWKPVVHGFIGACQSVQGILAHLYDREGNKLPAAPAPTPPTQ